MIFAFDHDHVGAHSELRKRLGGKGFSLWLMTRKLGLPVPVGFTIEAELCRAFLEGRPPAEFNRLIERQIDRLGGAIGRPFADEVEPLLVSVRSGAASSMPGMMDTVLNVGMTPRSVTALSDLTGDPIFALRSYRRFLASYASTVLKLEHKEHKDKAASAETEASLREGISGFRAKISGACDLAQLDDPWHQLFSTVEAVFHSWNSPRALTYRAREGISEDMGTAVNVQAMVFGNLDHRSGTGVAFTRNPSTGEPFPCGDFLFRAQGDDVVGGTHRTLPLEAMGEALPDVYAELMRAMAKLEEYYRDLCDIEFTVERGKLWMLQARVGKRSPAAAPRIAVDLVREGKVDRAEAVRRINPDLLSGAIQIERTKEAGDEIARGLGASPGVATGQVVFDPDRVLDLSAAHPGVILVRRETSPEDVHGMGLAKGIVTTLGGMMSHAAVVARAWNIPAVCGVADAELTEDGLRIGQELIREGDILSIDGDTGAVYRGPIHAEATVDPHLEILRRWAAEVG